MINKMIDGIVRQIRQSYGEEKYEIYTEAVKQGLKEPCFSVLCLNPSLRRKLGPRFLKTVPFIIRYWPKSDNCHGEGYVPQKRPPYVHQLTEAEAEEYTMEKVLNTPVYPAEP